LRIAVAVFFYRPDALPVALLIMSKDNSVHNWQQHAAIPGQEHNDCYMAALPPVFKKASFM